MLGEQLCTTPETFTAWSIDRQLYRVFLRSPRASPDGNEARPDRADPRHTMFIAASNFGVLLGPFWLTASMAVMVVSLGVIYAELFKTPINDFLPLLCVGLLVWNLMASFMTEGGAIFTTSESYIQQIRLPYSVYVYRSAWSKLIIFAHNFVIYFGVLIYFKIWPGAIGPAGHSSPVRHHPQWRAGNRLYRHPVSQVPRHPAAYRFCSADHILHHPDHVEAVAAFASQLYR